MNLTQEERNQLPGWLLKLLDSEDYHEIDFAARHCSTRYYCHLLSQRADELALVAVLSLAPRPQRPEEVA